MAKKEGIEIEGSHNRAIELTEPMPALVVYNGARQSLSSTKDESSNEEPKLTITRK